MNRGDPCPVCGTALQEIHQELRCMGCGAVLEACCDGGEQDGHDFKPMIKLGRAWRKEQEEKERGL